jgi:dTDP-4-amino-4,6-dideoxygalactose transaminase
VNVHYIPVHTQPYYQGQGFQIGDFPEAERYYSEAISLPIFPAMTSAETLTVVKEVSQAIG